MEQSEFWSLIDTARGQAGADPEALLECVRNRLMSLPPEKSIAFLAMLDELRAKAYRWDLWGAAYVLNGGCSDDGFDYFRAWLISRGQKTYEAAVENPDSLADHFAPLQEEYELEGFLYLPIEVYEELTGHEMDPDVSAPQPSQPVGEDWDFDDQTEVQRRLPRLFAAEQAARS